MIRNSQRVVQIVSRPKLTGFGEHWGVLFPSGRVAHHTPSGVSVVGWREFAQGRPIKLIKDADPNKYTQIMKRLDSSLNGSIKYQLFGFNCEDFANWLIGEKPRSPQVEFALAIGAVVAVLCAA